MGGLGLEQGLAYHRAGAFPQAEQVYAQILQVDPNHVNTWYQRALLATQGFRDSVEIGRENRYELYDLMLENPRPLVPRYLRFDVPQRTLADGSTLVELDEGCVHGAPPGAARRQILGALALEQDRLANELGSSLDLVVWQPRGLARGNSGCFRHGEFLRRPSTRGCGTEAQ